MKLKQINLIQNLKKLCPLVFKNLRIQSQHEFKINIKNILGYPE